MSDIKEQIIDQFNELRVLRRLARGQEQRKRGPRGDPGHGQGRVLALLALKSEMTQRELAYLFGASKQALAQILRRLEDGGLIEREPSQDDRRVAQVRLTAQGSDAAANLADDSAAGTAMLAVLDDAELSSLSSALGKIIAHLRQNLPDRDGLTDARLEQRLARLSRHARLGEDDRFGSDATGHGPRHDRAWMGSPQRHQHRGPHHRPHQCQCGQIQSAGPGASADPTGSADPAASAGPAKPPTDPAKPTGADDD
ncbi:MAG: MarR family winged helix-turn-helix transcriptional regulator [Bifidobacteriaceae bacterium]|jgi:DNA-binding MarR family transcriptional regulator|nr:MarR family winged helix-turn-helix transcriptional regulator [Bifidobacteriaceae bacterium]